MSNIVLFKKYFVSAVEQEFGEWLSSCEDTDLGAGVFIWTGYPEVKIFEKGFIYKAVPHLNIRYDELISVDLLDLPSLMKAQKFPFQNICFGFNTKSGNYVIEIPLVLYTVLSSFLIDVIRQA